MVVFLALLYSQPQEAKHPKELLIIWRGPEKRGEQTAAQNVSVVAELSGVFDELHNMGDDALSHFSCAK